MDGISIILPVYNAENTIERCLDSLLCQTYVDFEILAINDGSNDRSPLILKEYAAKDSRIKVISQQNKGVSATRNIGLRLANREWVTFCDADDEVMPGWLQTMAENMRDFDFVATGIRFINNDGTVYDKMPKRIQTQCSSLSYPKHIGTLIDGLISAEVFGFTWCKLFRRDIIINHNVFFDPLINFREDELWCISYLEHVRSWKSIPYIGYKYYLPAPKKSYKGNFTDFTTPIFKVYNRIFPTRLTPTIAKFYYRLIRDVLALSISDGRHPQKDLTEGFQKILRSYNESRSFISKIIDFLLANSDIFYVPAKILLRANNKS